MISKQYDELVWRTHTFDIDSGLIKPGMKLDIRSDQASLLSFSKLNIGAPNHMDLKIAQVHFFEENNNSDVIKLDDHPEWRNDFVKKMPISSLQLSKAPDIVFNEVTMCPIGNYPAIKCTSKADYIQKATAYFDQNPHIRRPRTISFDGTVNTIKDWRNALIYASGKSLDHMSFYVGMYNGESEGSGGGLQAVGNAANHGFMLHEFAHAFTNKAVHTDSDKDFPYKCYNPKPSCTTDLTGIPMFNGTSAGPTWAFDPYEKKYIPPTVQNDYAEGIGYRYKKVGNYFPAQWPGKYKISPVGGGGTGMQGAGYYFNHFSDYNIDRFRKYFEYKHLYFDKNEKAYKRWNTRGKKYYNIAVNYDDPWLPKWQNVPAYSILMQTSSTSPQANVVYPPIGPYKTGTNSRYDPRKKGERERALKTNYCQGKCDYTVRFKQGGKYYVLMVPMSKSTATNPADPRSLKSIALNVEKSRGKISEIDLHYTPDVANQGVPCPNGWVVECPIVASWSE